MNEAIGVKGGRNDRKRVRIIQKKRKKRENEERDKNLEELEKSVKKRQIYTLVKTLPIVVLGGTVKTFYDTANGKKKDLEEEGSKWKIKEYDQDISSKTEEEFLEEKRKKQQRKRILTTPFGEEVVVTVFEGGKKLFGGVLDEVSLEQKKDSISDAKEALGEVKEGSRGEVFQERSFSEEAMTDISLDELTPRERETFYKLKSRRIIEEFEKELKDIRYDLRRVIYEYNVLVQEDENVTFSKDAEIILDRLSDVILKIEELKSHIQIDRLEEYDSNYIYYLIEGYMKEFHDKRVVDEMKDSSLYILISEKLEELDKKKGEFSHEVSSQKEELEEREESFQKLQEKFYSIERLNKDLYDFQKEQDRLLREVQEKVRNSLSVTEKVEVEFRAMDRQSRRLMRMLAFQMFLPGARFGRGVAASTASYLYFVRQILNPETTTKKYRVITVEDYSEDILNAISSLEDASLLLQKTSSQIDRILSEIYEKYGDYIGVFPECDSMISNLLKIKSEVEEKEYEMEVLRKKQERELERNNAKVKERGQYSVN